MQKNKNKSKNFFEQDTVSLAKELLGKLIVVKSREEILSGYITETEAYLGVVDKACHGYNGKRTPKVEALYQEAGTVYIYTMHTHKMLNIVSCEKDNPQAVLIRGIEPDTGKEIMEENRGKTGVLITNGPGKLTKAMGINDKFNMSKVEILRGKIDIKEMKENTIYIDFEKSKNPLKIEVSARIGIPDIGVWTKKPLRFYVAGNGYVSGMRKSEYTDKCWKDL